MLIQQKLYGTATFECIHSFYFAATGTHVGQGDILFREGEEEAEFESGTDKRKRDAIRDTRSRWPNAEVPYVFDGSLSK